MIIWLVALYYLHFSCSPLTEESPTSSTKKRRPFKTCTAMLKSGPINLSAHAQTHDSSIYDIYTAAQSVIYTSASASA